MNEELVFLCRDCKVELVIRTDGDVTCGECPSCGATPWFRQDCGTLDLGIVRQSVGRNDFEAFAESFERAAASGQLDGTSCVSVERLRVEPTE